MIEALKQLVNGDEALVRRGRFLTTTFLLEVGQNAWLIAIFEGPDCFGDVRPLCHAIVIVCAARGGSGMGKILQQPAAARLA